MRPHTFLAPLAVAVAACDPSTPPKPDPAAASATAVVSGTATQATPGAPSAAPAGGVHAELAAMDGRTPVPLQPMMAWHQKQNMMDHLVAIQGITAALAEDDWDAVAKASAKIESSPQMQQMCQHMGAGAEGFTELALEFHQRANAIGEAAAEKDAKKVLRATSHTLEACTKCHATYKQEVVDAATWQARTGSSHDPGAMHHPMH